jgi:DNA mismatch repair protein MutS
MADVTPMMAQYQSLKKRYHNCLLFFRMGDFYEMFYEDATIAAKVLGITLTSRAHGKSSKVPLAGVPWHSADTYIARLIKAGYKVAICEQIEDASQSKGIVKRDVVQVVTPGTTVSERILSQERNNYLLAIDMQDGTVGLAAVDLSTGEFELEEVEQSHLDGELEQMAPTEVLVPSGRESFYRELIGRLLPATTVSSIDDWRFSYEHAYRTLTDHFQTTSLKGFGCEDLSLAVGAAGAALQYLKDNQQSTLTHINSLSIVSPKDYMMLDATTVRNLEILEPLREGLKKATLGSVLHRVKTTMGARRLERWLRKPLLDRQRINDRMDAVEELVNDASLRQELRASLKQIADLERLIGRVGCGRANARDLNALKESLQVIPNIRTTLNRSQADLLTTTSKQLNDLLPVVEKISNSLVDDPPVTLNDGGLIREGYHQELDDVRQVSIAGKSWIARLQEGERRRTNIRSLKVGYNRVFGYYIEVTKANLSKVPENYIRKQTLANAERFITPDLKEQEARVLGAEDRIKEMEYQLFLEVRDFVAQAAGEVQKNARLLARLDVLASLATVAVENDYRRPVVDESEQISIRQGRHPVVEKLIQGETFVPNDAFLDNQGDQILIITGPNMAGKSTYLRQVGLIVLLAQMGSFVPAEEARIGLVDRIFTRVGASDSLATGESTFLVEMNETANILHNATRRSLLLLDEIGRGTSTFDGLSIAWAVAEYIHNTPGISAKTLFATHYHELTELALILPRVKNYNVAVKEWQDHVVFLRKIVEGGCDHSYGIQVARLAGLPAEVIARAKEVLVNLEEAELTPNKIPRLAMGSHAPPLKASPQLSLFTAREHPVLETIRSTDVERLTPLEALNILQQIKDQLQQEET